MKVNMVILLVVFNLVFFRPVQAQIITLKSGKVFNGEIIEKAPEYIKVKYNGLEIYYENKYVKSIEDESLSVAAAAASKEVSVQELAPLSRPGIALAAAGEFSAARQEFDKQISDLKGALNILDAVEQGELSKEFAIYLFQGSLHIMNKEYDLAKTSLEKAWEIKPVDPDVNFNLGFVAFSLGEYEKSLVYLYAALKAQPNDPWAYELIAKDYCNLGEFQKARQQLLTAKDLSEKNGDQAMARHLAELLRIVETVTP